MVSLGSIRVDDVDASRVFRVFVSFKIRLAGVKFQRLFVLAEEANTVIS